MHQNLLEAWLKCRSLDPIPRVSDVVSLRWGLRICISHFETCWVRFTSPQDKAKHRVWLAYSPFKSTPTFLIIPCDVRKTPPSSWHWAGPSPVPWASHCILVAPGLPDGWERLTTGPHGWKRRKKTVPLPHPLFPINIEKLCPSNMAYSSVRRELTSHLSPPPCTSNIKEGMQRRAHTSFRKRNCIPMFSSTSKFPLINHRQR